MDRLSELARRDRTIGACWL